MNSIKSLLIVAAVGISQSACGPQIAVSTVEVPPDGVRLPTSTPQPAPDSQAPVSEIVSLDDEWNRYTNHRLGFSMLVPKSHYRYDADCYWNETDDDRSFRPSGGMVPVVIIEGQDRVFVASQFYADLTQPTQVPSGNGYRIEFAGCEKIENSLERMATEEETSYKWEIVVREIEVESDLELLVDEVYGECFQVGEIEPIEGSAHLRVKVLGDGRPVEESTCLLRGGYVFLYSPEIGRAATWLTGQSYHFVFDPIIGDGYDAEMVASFEFIAP